MLKIPSEQARLQWAQGHLNWNNVRWQNVLFSDESRFCIDHADGRVRVWKRRGDRYADNCVVENNAWGGPSLMLWGAIGHNQVLGPVIFQGLGPGRGNGITAQRYMDQVLHPHVLPFFQAHGNWVFQNDNARPHTVRATQDLLQRSGIQAAVNSPPLGSWSSRWMNQGSRESGRLVTAATVWLVFGCIFQVQSENDCGYEIEKE
nr:hypothetical protein BaRGS_035127 [Batillaria attramentaria]